MSATLGRDAESARNASTAERMYEAERQRDIEAWVPLWHEDARQTFPFDTALEVRGIDRLRAITEEKFLMRAPYEIHTRIEPFADPRQVLARLRLEMTGSTGATVHIWCLFHFDADGLITEVEEMLDTASS